jgi:signal transduction histidine kinase
MLKFVIAAASAAVLTLSSVALAQQPSQFGNAQEAKAMLERAVAAVKADKDKALFMFNLGEGGFLDRDLYPFCVGKSDGKVLATQVKQTLGQDARTFKDATGKAFGQEVLAAAKEGQTAEVSFMFPKPGADTTPRQKVAYVSAIGDLVCGVGYYN